MSADHELKKIKDARDYVRDIANDTQVWALVGVFKDKLKFSKKGRDYEELLGNLGPEDMAFAYAKIVMGDEVSRREKFILISWVGSQVSAVKRARMMVSRCEVDQLFDQRAKVVEASDLSELALSVIKQSLVKAGGADYGSSTS